MLYKSNQNVYKSPLRALPQRATLSKHVSIDSCDLNLETLKCTTPVYLTLKNENQLPRVPCPSTLSVSHSLMQSHTRTHLLRVESQLAALEDGAQALALAVAQLVDAAAALLAQALACRLRLPVRLLQRRHASPLLLLEPAHAKQRTYGF